MNDEFNWWLLIVGLVIGAGLVWLIFADGSRREADVSSRERASEARWIAEELRRMGRVIADRDVEEVLELHGAYLAAPPPDEPAEDPPVGSGTPPEPAAASLASRSTIAEPTGGAPGDGDSLPV